MARDPREPDTADAVLVAQAKASSEEALARLTARYYQPIRLLLLRRTGDPDLADDLTQETFLRAVAHLDDLRDERCFRAWLYQIAYHTYGMDRRSRERLHIVPLDEAAEVTANPAPSPTDVRVQAILDALPPTLRRVLEQHDLHGDTVPDIARTLGISVALAYKQVSRAKHLFQKLYATQAAHGENDNL